MKIICSITAAAHLPEQIADRTLRTLKEKLTKIDAKVVRYSRYVIFQKADVSVTRALFCEILEQIRRLRCVKIVDQQHFQGQ